MKKIQKYICLAVTMITVILSGCISKINENHDSMAISEIEKMEIKNDNIIITGNTTNDGEDIISDVKYTIYKERENGDIAENIIVMKEAEAMDKSFDSPHEKIQIKIPVTLLVPDRYKIKINVNKSNSYQVFNLVIDKNGNIADEQFQIYYIEAEKSFYCVSNNICQNRYSYVIYKVNTQTGKDEFVKEGIVFPIKKSEETYYNEINMEKIKESGSYKIKFYRETLEEINGNYDDFICINKDINGINVKF